MAPECFIYCTVSITKISGFRAFRVTDNLKDKLNIEKRHFYIDSYDERIASLGESFLYFDQRY